MVNLPSFDASPAGRSANLGWLLQNTQASDAEVCTFLLEVYRGEMERMAAALLHSPSGAMRAVEDTVAWAIANREQYRSEVPGKAWLFEHLVQECENALSRETPGQRAIDAFDPGAYSGSHYDELLRTLEKETALLLILQYGHGLSPEEIAYTLKLPVEQVQAGLQQNRERLVAHQQTCPVCASSTGGLAMLETLLSKALPAGEPIFGLGEAYLAQWRSSILKQSTHQQAARQTRSWLKQAFQAGLFLVLLAVGWLLTGRLSNEKPPALSQPGTRLTTVPAALPQPTKPFVLVQPATLTQSAVRAATADARTAMTAASAATATASASATVAATPNLAAILQLANNSRNTWHSLWADVQVTRYDLVANGAIAQQVVRKQTWIIQPSLDRVITGSFDELPGATYTVTNNTISGQSFGNGQTFTEVTTQLVPDTDLQKLFIPEDMFLSGGTFTTAGRSEVGNRPTWVLEWTTPGSPLYRFWVDAQYGVILRRQEIDGLDLKTVIADTLVDSIIFNAPFPPAIFELQQYKGDHFASDFSGSPEAPDLSSALASWSPSPAQLPATGGLPPGRSAILSCERSPDGSKLAYTIPASSATGDNALRVLDLTASHLSQPVLPDGITTGDYAFSPDGQRLAFFGCDKASGFCGVFILDTHSAKLTPLVPVIYADYIFWRSDGRYLALVGEDNTAPVLTARKSTNLLISEITALSQSWHFLVVDASSGAIVYKQVYTWLQMSAPVDSPTNSWDTSFKTRLDGPEGCANAIGNGK